MHELSRYRSAFCPQRFRGAHAWLQSNVPWCFNAVWAVLRWSKTRCRSSKPIQSISIVWRWTAINAIARAGLSSGHFRCFKVVFHTGWVGRYNLMILQNSGSTIKANIFPIDYYWFYRWVGWRSPLSGRLPGRATFVVRSPNPVLWRQVDSISRKSD